MSMGCHINQAGRMVGIYSLLPLAPLLPALLVAAVARRMRPPPLPPLPIMTNSSKMTLAASDRSVT